MNKVALFVVLKERNCSRMKKILIISAMVDVELNYLIEKLENKKIEETNVCRFYLGKIYENDIILCDAKVGLINTASSITLAIEKYHPDYIINQGCAGACSKYIHKSDIVIGEQCINITSFYTKEKKEGQGYNLDDWELINYTIGEKDRLIPQNAGEKLLKILKETMHDYTEGKIHYGIIGSGDIWNKEIDWMIRLNKKYNIICLDMEGIAVYTIANMYKIPAIDIRVISDNEILGEKYDRNISIKGQEFIIDLLKQL